MKRPQPLGVLMVLSTLSTLALSVVGPLSLLADADTYTWLGVPLSRGAFTFRAATMIVLAAGCAASVAWALWTERPWSRELILVCGAVIATILALATRVAGLADSGLASDLGLLAIFVGVPAAYLYGARSAREYYSALRGRGTA